MSLKVVTIDGPAASGKSSVACKVARKLGWPWLSTGAFYRGLAFVAQKKKIPLDSEEQLATLAHDSSWEIRLSPSKTRCFFQSVEITDEIYKEPMGSLASQVSLFPKVRKNLLKAQRKYAESGKGLVAEGRDCGTVIFPQAFIKFFLTAEDKNRALRRAKESGKNLEITLKAQNQRDARDTQRTNAPMKIPVGAYVLDTSYMNLNEVIQEVYLHVRQSCADCLYD